nr:Ig-like domain-containing protein [Rhodanobacter sp. DHG33]
MPAYGNTATVTATVPDGTGTVAVTVTTDAGTYTAGNYTFTPPTVNAVSATVGYDSSNNAIGLSVNGTPDSVGVIQAAAHGVARSSGTSITYTPTAGYVGSDSFTYAAKNRAGTSSAALVSITVGQATQTITFANPGAQNFGTTPTLTATATSNLPVTFTSSTTAVCTAASNGTLTFITAGTCTVNANQAGNTNYTAAPQVSQSFTVNGVVPGEPAIGTASAGPAQATVTFTVPLSSGGSPITSYTATSSPGGNVGTCASSPCTVTGLVNGTSYTFTVTATNGVGTGSASAASNAVTPEAAQTITYANPGTQNFGTTPTLTASATSGLPVTFTSSTTAVCTVTSGGVLTVVTPGSCTINANQAGNGAYLAAAQVSQTFAIAAVVPGEPTIGTATAGAAQATVTFTAPTSNGGAAITQYVATSSPGGLTSVCAGSPCAVTGLTNGTAYTFTVTATNSAGSGMASVASNSVIPKAAGTITNFVATPAAPVYRPNGTFTVSATGTGSSSPLVFALGGSSGAVCSIQGGTVTTLSAGTCTVTANQAGDGSHLAAPQVTLAVTISNPPAPTASNVSASASYNTAASINLASAIAGVDITAVTVGTAPTHGTVSVSGETVTYTPSSTFYGGTDSFTYTATNPGGTSAPATVTLTVGTPAAPTAAAKAVTTPYNTAASINLASAIAGVDITAVTVGTSPTHGTVNVSGETVTYTPSSTFYGGTDSFSYTATNPGGTSVSATVTITVGAPAAPTVAAKTVTTTYNMAASINLASAITGIDITTVTIGTSPAHGTVNVSGETVTYTPSSTFYGGTDSFTYTATNPGGTSAPATVTITVGAPAAPTVASKAVTTPYNTVASINLTSAITGIDITAVTIGTPPAHGTVSVSGETVTYTPSSMFYGGTDSFTYTATNPGGTSAPATVTVTVGTPAAPTVVAKAVTTSYNTMASINLASAITGIDITAVTIGTAPAHGTVSVSGETVTYMPSSTFYGGTDSFTYTATNPGGTSAPATVTVTVGTPAAPTVAAKTVTTPYNTAASINLSGAITGIDITAVTIGTAPAHGTVSVSGEMVTYTPSSTFYGGTDSFTYTATNPGGTSAPATVTMTVTPLSVPAAQAISVSTTTGTPVLIDATVGATGVQPFTGVNVASAPSHGSASASGGQITYTPAAGFIGSDTFTYRVANHFGSSAPATITVTVTAAGRAGAATGTKTATTAPGVAVTLNLAQIVPDTYVSSALIGLSPGDAGQVALSQPATLTFTPAQAFRGLAQISVVLTTASGHQVTIDVLVLVSSQPDPSKNPDVLGLVNAQAEQAQRFAQSQLDNIDGRLENLHDGGGTALFSNTLSISVDGQALQAPRQGDPAMANSQPGSGGPIGPDRNLSGNGFGTLLQPGLSAAGGGPSAAMGPEVTTGNAAQSAAAPLKGPAGLGFWIAGTANFGTFEAYRQAAGFDSNDIAVNLGVDQRISQHALFGFSLGYNHDNADIANDGTRSIAQGYSAAMYGSYQPAPQVYIDAVLGGGGLSFDSRRYDADSGSFLTGRRTGSEWFGSLTAGYEYHNQGGLLWSPYLRLEQSLSELNGFSEQGAATAALSYGRQTVRTSLAVLGLRVGEQFSMDWGVLAPRARLEVGHDFQGTSDTNLSYAFIPSAGSWNVLTNPYAANGTSVQLGLGLDLQLPRDLRLTTDYEYLTQPHAHDQMIRLGLSKQF